MAAKTRREIPAFREVFPPLFRAGVDVLTVEQLEGLAESLSEEARQALADFLGPDGVKAVAEGLPEDKAVVLVEGYPMAGESDEVTFRRLYPEIMLATNRAMTREQLETVIAGLSAEEIASQSLYLGGDGRRKVFSALGPELAAVILAHTPDWVLIETAKDALKGYDQYRCILEKQERVKGKLQKLERIELKARNEPRAFYMKWLPGLFKGRELLYNVRLYGPDELRVREGGLLGVVAVTLNLDGALSGRGTNHRATEVGLHHLVDLLEADYAKAEPHGHVERIDHGIVQLDGRPVYKIESRLPRDRSYGYYCHRVVHYTDYVEAVDVKAEVYDFDDRLKEAFHYRELQRSPGFTDRDFDPGNPAYKL